MRAAQRFFGGVALHALGAQVNQHHMGVSAASDDIQPALHQLIRQSLGVKDNLAGIGLELWPQCLAKGHGFCGDHVHQGAALDAGEDG